jgi:hypothetical protein
MPRKKTVKKVGLVAPRPSEGELETPPFETLPLITTRDYEGTIPQKELWVTAVKRVNTTEGVSSSRSLIRKAYSQFTKTGEGFEVLERNPGTVADLEGLFKEDSNFILDLIKGTKNSEALLSKLKEGVEPLFEELSKGLMVATVTITSYKTGNTTVLLHFVFLTKDNTFYEAETLIDMSALRTGR